jgi:hypothetical protein
VDGRVRDGVGVSLKAIEQMLVVQPGMIDAWMDLRVLLREAKDDGSMASVREQLDDAAARLLSGAEQIRAWAHRYRSL